MGSNEPSSSSSPSTGYSYSAILFSSALLQHLETHPTLRPSGGAREDARDRRRKLVDASNSYRVKNSGDGDDDEWVPNVIDEKGLRWEGRAEGDGRDGVVGSETFQQEGVGSMEGCDESENNNIDNGDKDSSSDRNFNASGKNSNPREIVYKVTNPDGTQRRMTKQEKKQLKYQLQLAKHTERKEERQIQHEQRIREAKKEARERKRLKKLAWRKKQQQGERQHQEGKDHNIMPKNGGNSQKKDLVERQINDRQNEQQKPNLAASITPNKPSEIIQQCSHVNDNETNHDQKNNCKLKHRQQSNTSGHEEDDYDEELAALRGERKGIPPVMLTPAATCMARELGALQSIKMQQGMTTIMDHSLSQQWALQLQQSMIPVEESRAKEDIRPMAYRLVPESWRRLCPDSLWISGMTQEERNDKQEKEIKQLEKDHEVEKQNRIDEGDFDDDVTSMSIHLIQQKSQYALALVRNPSPSYDQDAYLIFRHLHQYSNLHIACGAIFGCDFLLYDGSRDDRHSFAGIRVYSSSPGNSSGLNNCLNNGDGSGDDSQNVVASNALFPIPSAYDLSGYVRAMNTARKIALIATVIRTPPLSNDHENGNENSNVARVAIVDLALEKVLSAPTHIKKGSTIKRRSEEEVASALAKQRQRL